MADFNATATLLRQKYNEAIRKAPNQRSMRQVSSSRMKKPKQRRKKVGSSKKSRVDVELYVEYIRKGRSITGIGFYGEKGI